MKVWNIVIKGGKSLYEFIDDFTYNHNILD